MNLYCRHYLIRELCDFCREERLMRRKNHARKSRKPKHDIGKGIVGKTRKGAFAHRARRAPQGQTKARNIRR